MTPKDRVATGAFLVGGLVLFGLGLFLIGDRRMLFSKSVDYHTEFSRVSALEVGAKVRVGGMDAGELTEIVVPQKPGSKFRLKFRIVDKFVGVIRTDSVASIGTDGLLGNKFLLVDIGTTGQAPPGWVLPSREPFEITDLLEKIRQTVTGIDRTFSDAKGDISSATQSVASATQSVAHAANRVDQIIVAAQEPIAKTTQAVGRISEDVSAVVAKVDRTFDGVQDKVAIATQAFANATQSVADAARRVDRIAAAAEEPIAKTTDAANRISDDIAAIVARIRSGEGTLGKLVNDDAIYRNVSHSSGEIDQVLRNLNLATADVKDLISRFKAGDVPEDLERTVKSVSDSSERIRVLIATIQPAPGAVDGLAADLRGTLSNAREAMADLAEDLEALKHGFFFRGFFKDRGFYDLGSLSIAEYQSREFEKHVTKERLFVRCDELFVIDANSAETLSESGKKQLNAMMANFLRFTNDRAVIVEGYAVTGTGTDQFLRSRDRATKVRDYLVKTFTLNPGYIGVMPMGATGGSGDGVALVLLKK